MSLRESSALAAPRIYSTVTSRITDPPVSFDDPWEFPLVTRYAEENATSIGRVGRAPGQGGVQLDVPPGALDGRTPLSPPDPAVVLLLAVEQQVARMRCGLQRRQYLYL